MTLTKRDLVIRISDETNLGQQEVFDVVQKTLDYITESLAKGDKVELRNFGVFEVKQRKPRKARNPRTGDRVDVAAKNVVTFQPGKTMEEKVRKLAKPVEPKKKTKKSKHVEPMDGKLITSTPTQPPEHVGAGSEVSGTVS